MNLVRIDDASYTLCNLAAPGSHLQERGMLQRGWKVVALLISGFVLFGCAYKPVSQEAGMPMPDLVVCEEPRPQICTAIYDPVCALTADNSYKTYASDCSACGDANVSGYRPGACE
jgi:hypothetical protein